MVRTIMLVDSENAILQQVKAVMADEAVSVVEMRSARHAFEYLDQKNDCDLLLVSSMLPVTREAVLIAISPDDRFSGVYSEHFLKKPFTDDQLKTFLANL